MRCGGTSDLYTASKFSVQDVQQVRPPIIDFFAPTYSIAYGPLPEK